MVFNIGGKTFTLTPNAQAFPVCCSPEASNILSLTRSSPQRALNTAIGGDDGSIYLITGDLGSDSGEGLDFIDGFAFLERFYYVFDVANSRVGFATTHFTDDTKT